jgi:putative intracellular protease/amidase
MGVMGRRGADKIRVLIPLPARDFDPTEAAVSWTVLRDAGHDVVFATPVGARAACDAVMISGEGLDPWGWIPVVKKIRLMGLVLRANRTARTAYHELERDAKFANPLRYEDLRAEAFDALLLPGGHRARGMRAYLEDATLQRLVAEFFDADKPVAAICHGVVLAARSISPKTGRSVLYGRETTALTWRQERLAAGIAGIARFREPLYYRTYADGPGQVAGYRSVQAEVTRALEKPGDFREPQRGTPDYDRKLSGTARDSATDTRPAFVVRDGTYVSARWPGDAHTFAKTFAAVLSELSLPSR